MDEKAENVDIVGKKHLVIDVRHARVKPFLPQVFHTFPQYNRAVIT